MYCAKHSLINQDDANHWVKVSIDKSWYETIESGAIDWLIENLDSDADWSLIKQNQFAFRDPGIALTFKMQFGF